MVPRPDMSGRERGTRAAFGNRQDRGGEMSDSTAERFRREPMPPAPKRHDEPASLFGRLKDWWQEAHRDRRGLRRPDGRKPSRPEMQAHAWYWFLAAALLMLFQSWWIANQTVKSVPYSEFLQLLHDHKLKSVRVEGQHVTG